MEVQYRQERLLGWLIISTINFESSLVGEQSIIAYSWAWSIFHKTRPSTSEPKCERIEIELVGVSAAIEEWE